MTDKLTQGWPRHWTGSVMGMSGLVRIDGAPYRWCGAAPQDVPELTQTGVTIERTSTIYRFEAADRGVALTVEFGSPHRALLRPRPRLPPRLIHPRARLGT